MFERTKNVWKVVLQSAAKGNPTIETTFEAYWRKDWEGINDEVGKCCAIMASAASHRDPKKRIGFAPISVELVTD